MDGTSEMLLEGMQYDFSLEGTVGWTLRLFYMLQVRRNLARGRYRHLWLPEQATAAAPWAQDVCKMKDKMSRWAVQSIPLQHSSAACD